MLVESGEFWKLLMQFDDEGFLMSGSTPGEGRFVDQAEPEIEGSLMPGYSYTIVQAKECQGH